LRRRIRDCAVRIGDLDRAAIRNLAAGGIVIVIDVDAAAGVGSAGQQQPARCKQRCRRHCRRFCAAALAARLGVFRDGDPGAEGLVVNGAINFIHGWL
jgi:hypothetical protein